MRFFCFFFRFSWALARFVRIHFSTNLESHTKTHNLFVSYECVLLLFDFFLLFFFFISLFRILSCFAFRFYTVLLRVCFFSLSRSLSFLFSWLICLSKNVSFDFKWSRFSVCICVLPFRSVCLCLVLVSWLVGWLVGVFFSLFRNVSVCLAFYSIFFCQSFLSIYDLQFKMEKLQCVTCTHKHTHARARMKSKWKKIELNETNNEGTTVIFYLYCCLLLSSLPLPSSPSIFFSLNNFVFFSSKYCLVCMFFPFFFFSSIWYRNCGCCCCWDFKRRRKNNDFRFKSRNKKFRRLHTQLFWNVEINFDG